MYRPFRDGGYAPTLAAGGRNDAWIVLVGRLNAVGLRSPTPPSLLPTYTCDLLDKVIIDVRIGDDLATTPIGVAENHLDGLLFVRDLPLREVADEDGFASHRILLGVPCRDCEGRSIFARLGNRRASGIASPPTQLAHLLGAAGG